MRTVRLLPVSPSMHSSRGVPGPGAVPGPAGYPGMGGTWSGGLPPPVDRMTDRCKNITLPQTSFESGKNIYRERFDQGLNPDCLLSIHAL